MYQTDLRIITLTHLIQKIAAQFNSSVDDASSDLLLPGLDWLTWLQTDQPHRSPYFPQMGDEVIYFFQGHQLYIEEVSKKQLYPQIKHLPWHTLPNLGVSRISVGFPVKNTRPTL